MRLPALASRPLASRQDEPTSAALTASGVTVPEKASKYVGGTMMEARRMLMPDDDQGPDDDAGGDDNESSEGSSDDQ